MDKHCEKLISDHGRHWRGNHLVYPVISRRAGGLSIGVNLSPGGQCNFRCVYCQVDREHEQFGRDRVELPVLIRELNGLLDMVTDGSIWRDETFSQTPEAMRRLNDVAFSGDGEPTLSRRFSDAVIIAADSLKHHHLRDAKLVVITNATRLHTKNFLQALETLIEAKSELWCKLDAGGQDRYAAVNRSSVPLTKICENIAEMARRMTVVIQSCFVSLHGDEPDECEIELYCERLSRILEGGGRIKQVQLYTIARPPTEDYVTALSPEQMARYAELIARRLPELDISVF